MNRNYNILSGALLLLVSGTCFQSCQQDDFGDLQPDIETLVAEGRYLTARSVDASELASDTEEPRLFAVGTPYRLVTFTKEYNKDNPDDETPAVRPRFNKVAWEGETSSGMRFINIDSEPDKWFGFSAREDETGGTDNLVSLDFYGFTYGKEAEHPESYIPVNGWKDDRTTKPSELTHTETVTDGILNDLMRGVLLNQNIQTAGKTKNNNAGNDVSEWPDNAYTQSVMPFRHCFSKLRFQVSQQGDEEHPDADGNPAPSFENLYVEKIEITGTYGTGKVYLHDGKVELSKQCDLNLPFKSGFSGRVTTKNTDVGDMIVFPSDGSALTGTTMGDGYNVGLSITVRSTEKKDIENMLVNTGSVDANGNVVIKETTDEAGITWYSGTIKKDKIIDYYDLTSTDTPLYFKQNTSYMLIITFQKDAVRIITVIPQVEEWLPGEFNEETTEPWQEQALGQPQMFNNIVWSDRNLGADDYDPLGGNFDKTVGYFYQSGRNIPYYPFNYTLNKTPEFSDKNLQEFAEQPMKWKNTNYRFFPVVDDSIRTMTGNSNWTMENDKSPQMVIPEKKPTNIYFDFLAGKDSDTSTGLQSNQDEHWEKGQSCQPLSGSWIIPTSKEYLTIFPSTPLAGNITMRNGNDSNDPMNWGPKLDDRVSVSTLRITVPYYVKGANAPTPKNYSNDYLDAWNTLNNNNDEGTTNLNVYAKGHPGTSINLKFEPDGGDPENGCASVYVISRENDKKINNIVSLSEYVKNPNDFTIKEWGTIYAIKNIYTDKAYRMRWRALIASQGRKTQNPCIYIEICRYRCTSANRLTETNYKEYDWDHPAATIYFPVCGLGDWTGEYINFGTECQYATSDPIESNGKTGAVQIKITGDNGNNAYISVLKKASNRNFAKQIRPIGGVNTSK